MGIKGLMKLIGDEAPSCIKEGEMKNYFGRKIAVDASMWYDISFLLVEYRFYSVCISFLLLCGKMERS
jgi:hypothetical protein